MSKSVLIAIMLIFSLSSCDWLTEKMCGEPKGDLRDFIQSVNTHYAESLELQQVPCYPNYAQITLKKEVNAKTLDSLDVELRRYDFTEVLVYNQNNKLIRGNTGSM
ncbi:hypothetical protein [Botryobacter ruber]|uniref:hypothetical protein n=1 Tax=Botryobacter ruber TaxID=2171629 RepID=UPI000FEC9111|nr:hypothetical protein [Botryobacter ruber]